MNLILNLLKCIIREHLERVDLRQVAARLTSAEKHHSEKKKKKKSSSGSRPPLVIPIKKSKLLPDEDDVDRFFMKML